jgi:hypothetical protein
MWVVAVLAETISVVVRRDAIELRGKGGREGFLSQVPNRTLCFRRPCSRRVHDAHRRNGVCDALQRHILNRRYRTVLWFDSPELVAELDEAGMVSLY